VAQYEADDAPRLGGGQKLTLLDATAQSIGFVGPVFSIAFLVPLLVGIISATGRGAGNAAPLAVVLASIGVLGLGWIISEYARRISAAGSIYDYISDGLGPRVGGTFGLVYYVGILGLGAGLSVLIGGTIHDTLEGEFGNALLSEGLWDVVVLVLVAAILYFGVAVSTRAQLVLALLSIATVFLFAVYVIIRVGGDNDVVQALSPSSSPTGMSGVLFGVLYGVLLFTGFETSANLGEETAHPKRDIPRAVLISVLLVAGFYFVVSYAQVAGFGFDLDRMAENAGAPLFALASPSEAGGFGSDLVRQLLEIVVVLDMLAVLIGVSVAGSRGLFALARDGRLPAALARVSPRSTPLNATILVLLVYVAVLFVTLFVPSFVALPELPHYFAVFSWFSTLGSFSLAAIYLVLSLGALRGLSDHPRIWAVWLAVLVSVLVTGAAIFGAVYKVQAPTIYAVWTAVGVLVVGVILSFVAPGRPPTGHEWDDLTEADQGPMKL
jgi:amino acid transporter